MRADLKGVVVVDIKCLGRPEHNGRKEIGAGDGRYQKREPESSRLIYETRGYDGMFGTVNFPYTEANEIDYSKY